LSTEEIQEEVHVIKRPPGLGGFDFVTLATLRAAQLIRGCTPKIEGDHKHTVTAQHEVAEGKIVRYYPPAITVSPTPVPAGPIETATPALV
jgi:hypothetical protein